MFTTFYSLSLAPFPFPELSCVCANATLSERAFYDNLEQHSICDKRCTLNCSAEQNLTKNPEHTKIHCKILFFNLTSVRQQSRNVKMYRLLDEHSQKTQCSCDEKLNTLYREIYCIPTAYLKEYSSYGSMRISRTITENMKALIFLCHTMKLRQECNYLANLCVLLEYSLDKQSPCSLFYQAQINDYTSEGTRQIKPNLFYKRGRNTIEDINKKLDQSYLIRRGKDPRLGQGLNFTVLEFNLRGDLLKFGRSNLKFLNLCAMQNGYIEIFFPENIHMKCRVSLEEAIESIGDTTFNSIFVQYYDGKTRLLKRIPILIKNLFQNQHPDSKNWQFLSRFYLINTISGHLPGHTDNPYSERNMVKKFESVRYLKMAELRFEVKDMNKIETPILILSYDFVNLSHSDFMYDFEFRVTFEKSLNFDTLFEILFPILLIVGLLLAIIETISFKIRDGKEFFDMEILFRFFVQFSSKVANTLFLVAVGVAGYIHVVYKTQTTVKILLPDGIEQEIKYFLLVALLLKFIKLAQHLFAMSQNSSIFFIDSERPKLGETGLLPTKNHLLETPSSVGSRHINFEPISSTLPSAWRNYFVANEWLELTTKRPISVFLHLFCVLILLYEVGMENFASRLLFFHLKRSEETVTAGERVSTDVILKVSTGLFCFVVSYTCQWLFNYLIWERYVKNPMQQFVDLCCFSNVSVFLFSHRCFGYYIHGRSPHGFADTDVCSMIVQLKREEDNLCGHRGLLPGSENQTFRMLAPKNLRIFYDRLVLPIQKPVFFLGNGQASKGNGQAQRNGNGMDYANKMTYQSINRFFMAFIDHVSEKMRFHKRWGGNLLEFFI